MIERPHCLNRILARSLCLITLLLGPLTLSCNEGELGACWLNGVFVEVLDAQGEPVTDFRGSARFQGGEIIEFECPFPLEPPGRSYTCFEENKLIMMPLRPEHPESMSIFIESETAGVIDFETGLDYIRADGCTSAQLSVELTPR